MPDAEARQKPMPECGWEDRPDCIRRISWQGFATMPENQPLQHLGASHLGAMFVILSGCVLLLRTASRTPEFHKQVARWLAAALLLMHPAEILISSLWGKLDRDNVLPLHLCDIVALLAAAALLTRKPLLIELAYFWGLGGTLQGVLTPTLPLDFPHAAYFRYFALHGLVVMAAIYLTFGLGHCPRPGSVWRVLLWSNAYLLVAGGVNALLGSNYGYTCRKPDQASLLDLMGSWPWYLATLEGLALGLFFLLDLPFRRQRRQMREET